MSITNGTDSATNYGLLNAKGVRVKTGGYDARAGTCTLSGGQCMVGNSVVAPDSIIIATINTLSGQAAAFTFRKGRPGPTLP